MDALFLSSRVELYYPRCKIKYNLIYDVLHCTLESRAQDPGVRSEVSPGRPTAEENKCLQVDTLLTVWIQQGRSLLQKSISAPGVI